jgi:pyruvate dehydrogenase E1 component
VRAQDLLLERYAVAADVWSVTSYKTLAVRTLEAERWNMWHADEPPRRSYLQKTAQQFDGPCVAVSDYVRLVSQQIAPWIPGLLVLGTDGFGRSDTRKALRRFFEIDAEHLAVAALYALSQQGKIEARVVSKAVKDLGLPADERAPWQR